MRRISKIDTKYFRVIGLFWRPVGRSEKVVSGAGELGEHHPLPVEDEAVLLPLLRHD